MWPKFPVCRLLECGTYLIKLGVPERNDVMKEREPLLFQELVDYVKSDLKKREREFDRKYIYTKVEICNRDNQPDDIFYIDGQPDVMEDCDVFPAFVQENNLTVFCSGENLIDVFENAIAQKKDILDMELLNALQYYLAVDGYYIFDKQQKKSKKYMALFPQVTKEAIIDIIHNFGESCLREHSKYFFSNASLIVSDDAKAELSTLCNVVARNNNIKTLYIAVLSNSWTHYLYQGNNIISPAKYVLPGQEQKKNPKTDKGPIASKFLSFSPESKEHIINLYLQAAGNCDEVKAECSMKAGRYFVREADCYPVGDGRQALDFLKYIGFDISKIF